MQTTFYTIYKTTNLVNGKYYIGKHQTSDLNDGYLGSGKLLKRAIDKYGIENFQKEILYIFDNENDMNTQERELVTSEFVLHESNYNLCPGGKGGWGYVNTLERTWDTTNPYWKNKNLSKSHRKNISDGRKGKTTKYDRSCRVGEKRSKETREKLSKSQAGIKNSQFGSKWITDGKNNRKLKSNETLPYGWKYGRA